jgi:hypothetical protein
MPENQQSQNPQSQNPQSQEQRPEDQQHENPHAEGQPTTDPQAEAQPRAEAAVSEGSQQAPEAPDTSEAASDDVHGTGSESVTTYEQTSEGHRITRRTVHRTETVEDRDETIEERFPVVAPTPYAPPASDHPAPVG